MTLDTSPPGPGGAKEKFQDPKSADYQDPARYLILPGDGLKTPGQLKHVRPHIVCGNKIFSWPVGIEGFRVTGQAQLSLHHYLGGNTVDAQTLHREEGRIELTGTFPGLTAVNNMIALRDLLRSRSPQKGMLFYAPGLFIVEQFVIPESWEFTHDADDRTHSIAYSVILVRVGSGKPIADPSGKQPPQNPGTKTTPKGGGKFFVVRAGARTFRQIAKKVYGNPDRWPRLVNLNTNELNKMFPYGISIPAHELPTHVWPIGMRIRYA